MRFLRYYKNKRNKTKKAFLIIEFVVYFVLFLFMFNLIFPLFHNFYYFNKKMISLSFEKYQMQNFIKIFVEDIMQAQSILDVQQNKIMLSVNNLKTTWQFKNNELYRNQDNSNNLIIRNIKDIRFYNENNKIRVEIESFNCSNTVASYINIVNREYAL